MRRKTGLQALLLAAGVLLAHGCVQDTTKSEAPAPTAAGAPDRRLKIAVVPKGTTHEFWQTIKAGADAAGKEFNAEILWSGPKSEVDIQDQIDILRNFGAQGVDGVALAATDKNALVQVVDELEGSGIPVVTIDSGVAGDKPRAFVATDNVAAARMAAAEMGRLLKGRGKVAVISFLKGAATSDEREQGFTEGIKQFPEIEVAAVVESKSDSSRARQEMEALLTRHPDLAGVFASNEPNVVGAAGVLKERNKAGKVKLIGFDASEAEIQYLDDGVVQAVVVQNPFKMGYEGVKALVQIIRGTGSPEKRIDTGAAVITQQNMHEPENRRLLFPLEDAGNQNSGGE